jgi:hypothetical protein
MKVETFSKPEPFDARLEVRHLDQRLAADVDPSQERDVPQPLGSPPRLARPGLRRRVAMVKNELVPVRVLEERLVADPGIEDVAVELDPSRRELVACGGDIVYSQRNSGCGSELSSARRRSRCR